ncbi:MAG: hypothetical protein ACI8P3_003446 [Saprospiraceae bacterium]|jgi:hypothetical protein
MKSNFYILSFLILLTACKTEENDLPNINVDESFEKHVVSFIEEGAKRGHIIDFEDTGLTIIFGNTPNASASCAEIGAQDRGSHQIIVNKNIWQSLNDSLQERLIFHELGHCELNRNHRNDKFADGSWKSIMRGDPLTELDERMPIPYFGFRRDYYLNELFDEQIQLPDWANQSFEYHDLPLTSKNLIIEKSNLSLLDDTTDLEIDDYEMEFEIRTISGIEATWVAWGTEEQHYFFWFKGNEFHFAANSTFQGPFHYIENDAFNFRETQKITIRQNGPFCKIFLNEQFFFMVDRLPSDLYFILSSIENVIKIDSYTLSEIL